MVKIVHIPMVWFEISLGENSVCPFMMSTIQSNITNWSTVVADTVVLHLPSSVASCMPAITCIISVPGFDQFLYLHVPMLPLIEAAEVRKQDTNVSTCNRKRPCTSTPMLCSVNTFNEFYFHKLIAFSRKMLYTRSSCTSHQLITCVF